jgi:hypothetical protein
MATVRELTLPMALELAANLDARDRMEILRAYPDLDAGRSTAARCPAMHGRSSKTGR